ncbi:predicted protein [Naegleria gruberi]|uniref:Cap-specific mRNA (nucleoside-2'-O-)-methyltransferase n=1 Tax=Naegleria gruberi TaxID=5762 RepID=D2VM22_NAEGR|nr:uncharacterized protein NAEGRDRAFT_69984 [Naegleria gruberi]EFC42151.1 predicted protein [Naegleria gruberi]|eukprot:XP_002674895.1 predicted protein [Naegleria gruberi strain NEG-M]
MCIDTFPKIPYSDENKRNRNALHWGQRKLLLSEIEFLTEYSHDGDVVIYAGAAPGSHLVYLAEVLFPNLKFMLVDPNKFNKDLYHVRNVTIMESYFTDEIAMEIKKIRNIESGNNLLFISDIRTADPLVMDPEQNEKCITEDLTLQKGWLEILLPRFSMLKFRLPFTEGKIKYFRGDIYLPVWGRKWTTECRLVIKEEDIKDSNQIEYDNLSYSDQLFYFNNITRFENIYPHDICSDGVDNW